MTTRRQVIIGGTAAVLGLSGCLEEVPEEEVDDGDGNGDGENGTTAGNGTDVNENQNEGGEDGNETETDEPATAEFEVTSVNAPSTVEVGVSSDWSVTVENTGDADGMYETTVSRTVPGGGEEHVRSVSLEVPAGESRTAGSSVRHDYVGDYVYTVGDTGETFTVTAEARELGFGDGYVNPDDVTVTVDGTEEFYEVRLTSSYTYTDDDGERRFDRAPDGSKYAVVSVRATKDTRDVVELPRRDEFTMFVGDEAYEPADRRADDEYEGGATRGRTREGVLMFEVDERFQRTNTYEVYWTRDYGGGSTEAIWST